MSNPLPSASIPLSPPPQATSTNVRWTDYAQVGGLLTAVCLGLAAVTSLPQDPTLRPELLLGPIFAMVLLTALVWSAMVIVRNLFVMRGLSDPSYFLAYSAAPPLEWTERPARTFNNLMQVPALFYVVCTLMLVTRSFDRSQLVCAWCYVALRAVHACVYIGWNYLPYRFAAWVASCITLGVLWFRFAAQAWPGF
jgi:hypothetical protein